MVMLLTNSLEYYGHTLDFGVLLLSIRKSSSVIIDSECKCEVDPIVLYLFLLPCGLDSSNGGCSSSEFFEEEECGELGLPSAGATEKRVLEDGEIDELLVVTITPPFSGFSSTLVPPPYPRKLKVNIHHQNQF